MDRTANDHLTDLGNAERLVAKHGDNLRYCAAWNRWQWWNDRYWVPDGIGKVMELAKDVVRDMYREASEIDSDNERQALINHAKRSESEASLRHMVSLAKYEPPIPTEPGHFDVNPWLLNCLNGTLDLESWNFGGHERNDLITKIVPIVYDEEATCPLWEGFLKRVMNDDVELIQFLQRSVGYSLCGSTSEQVLFVLFGEGSNGKSTFLETISRMLGDYAMHTPTETLLVRRGDAIPNDVARLKGARFVSAVESEDGRKLAAARVKELTGGDTVTARFMRGEFFEFQPEFKLFLAVNHLPTIRDSTDSIWRRICLIPFTVKIPKGAQDKYLKDKLQVELPGILNWAVMGFQEWREKELNIPKGVNVATSEYRAEMDTIERFIQSRCQFHPSARVQASGLFRAYENWCRANGDKVLTLKEFSGALTKKGYVNKRSGSKGAHEWHGIGLCN